MLYFPGVEDLQLHETCLRARKPPKVRFGGLGEHRSLLVLVLQHTAQKGNRDGCGDYGGFDHDCYPP